MTPTKALVIAFAVTMLYAVLHVAASYALEGVTLATRTATALAMPVGLLWLLCLGSTVWFGLQRNQLAAYALGTIACLVFTAGCGHVASLLLNQVEWPETTLPASRQAPLQAAVVLGGGLTIGPSGQPELGREGERIFSAAQLWHAGLTQSIIVTGATPDGKYNPCDIGRDILLTVGVPDEAIFRIGGETTTQEMREMEAFIKHPPTGFPPDGSMALITSAFHMRRAMRLAAEKDLHFIPFPCAFRASVYEGWVPSRWVPNAESMGSSALALKELMGGLVGR